MSERKLSDWLASNHFEDYAAAARALEERVGELLDEVDWYHDRAEAAEAEVVALKTQAARMEKYDVLLTTERDALRATLDSTDGKWRLAAAQATALRAKLEKVRAECEPYATMFRSEDDSGPGLADSIMAILDGEDSDE